MRCTGHRTVLDLRECQLIVSANVPNSLFHSCFCATQTWTVPKGYTSPTTQNVPIRPVLPPKTPHFNLSTEVPSECLSPDCIVTWLIHRLCSFTRSFMSRFQICYPLNIHWISIKNREFCISFGVTFQQCKEYLDDQILKAAGEWPAISAQSTNWSVHNTIRTQKLSCTQITAEVVGTVNRIWGQVRTWLETCLCMSGVGKNTAVVTRSGSLVIPDQGRGLGCGSNSDKRQVTSNHCWHCW